MGLAGRKVKQRIPADPRNLSWADDAARFGANYLAKFGWDSSKGLGASGDGRTSHIKVAHKLDMLGIGAAHQRDPNGIAWKQNKDFENLLIRLNEQTNQSMDAIGEADKDAKMDSCNAAEKPSEDEQRPSDIMEEKGRNKKRKEKKRHDEEPRSAADASTAEGSSNDAAVSKTKKKKERKNLDDGEADAAPPRDKQEGRKKKKEEKRKREEEEEAKMVDPARRKKRRKEKDNASEMSDEKSEAGFLSGEAQKVQQLPQRRAHRARAIASKNLASKSAAAISEILGIPFTPASTTPASGSATPNSETSMALGKLTTSTQSVGDYFKQKLKNKSLKTSKLSSANAQGDTTHEDDEPWRGGIGSIRAAQGALAEDTTALGLGFKSFASLTSSFVMTTLSRSGGDSDVSLAETDEKTVGEGKDDPASRNVSEKEKRKYSKKKTCKEKKS